MVEDHETGCQEHGAQDDPPPTTPPHETRARKCKPNSGEDDHPGREWARLVMEFLALLGLAYYAHQSSIQADASKQAADAATAANQQSAEQFRLAQRARMVLGRPDGKLMDLVQMNGQQVVRVFFSNVGHLPAQDVTLELWPVLVPPSREIDMSLDPSIGLTGPVVTPGGFYPSYVRVPADQAALIGTSSTTVTGRVRYRDDFGAYCEPVCGTFWGEKWRPNEAEQFELCPPQPNICVPGKHSYVFFGAELRPGQSVTIPGPGPRAQ